MKRALALAAVVLLAGCAFGGGSVETTGEPPDGGSMLKTETDVPTPTKTPIDEPTVTSTRTTTDTSTATQTPPQTPTATPTPTPEPVPTMVVTVDNPDDWPDYRHEQLRTAAAYWSPDRLDDYAAYDVADIVYKPNVSLSDATVIVESQPTIDSCDDGVMSGDFVGCAPLLFEYPDSLETVTLAENQLAIGYRNTAMHEFGHVLGIAHHQRPHWLMGDTPQRSNVTNASDRAQPFNASRTLRIGVRSLDSVSGASAADVRRVVERYDETRDADVRYVESWRNADIVFSDDALAGMTVPSKSTTYSQPYVSGIQLDSDDDFEFYTGVNVYVHEGEQEFDAGYHVGHWIEAYAMGGDSNGMIGG